MQSLEAEIKLLRRQLEAPSKREAELEQMNSYLMRELERYQAEAERAAAVTVVYEVTGRVPARGAVLLRTRLTAWL